MSMLGASAQASTAEWLRGSLEVLQQGELAMAHRYWETYFNPDDPRSSLAVLGRITGNRIEQAQLQAIDEAGHYLSMLGVDKVGLSEAKYRFYDAGVGTAHAGRLDLNKLGNALNGVYDRLINAGMDPERAAASTRAFLNRIVATEPGRMSNAFVIDRLNADSHFTGRWKIVLTPNSCFRCQSAAEQEFETKVFPPIHPFCRCSLQPETQKPRSPYALPELAPEEQRAIDYLYSRPDYWDNVDEIRDWLWNNAANTWPPRAPGEPPRDWTGELWPQWDDMLRRNPQAKAVADRIHSWAAANPGPYTVGTNPGWRPFLDAARRADSNPITLYRGMGIDEETFQDFLAKAPGDTIDNVLSSFSDERSQAANFGWVRPGSGRHTLMIEMPPGTQPALPIEAIAGLGEAEWVVPDSMTVAEVTTGGPADHQWMKIVLAPRGE